MSDTAPSTTASETPRAHGLPLRGEVIDAVVAACLVVTALGFWFGAASFAEVDSTGIGPATFPRDLAVLLGVGSCMLLARSLAGLSGWAPAAVVVTERPIPVVVGIALVAAFPLLMTSLGYYVASALWMPALFLAAGYRKPIGIVLYTAGFMLFARVAFEMILGVRLP